MCRQSIAIAFAALLMMTSTSRADHDHVHDQHPTTQHMGDFERVFMDSNWQSPITENLNGPVEEVLFFQMFSNCTAEPVTITIQETRTKEHSYSLGAAFEWGGMAEVSARLLVARGKAQAHSQVTFTGELSVTLTVQYQITEQTVNPPCNRKSFLQTIERYQYAGSMSFADHDGGCWSWCCEAWHFWQCGAGSQSADVVGFDGRHSQWNPEGSCGECPPDPCDGVQKIYDELLWELGVPEDQLRDIIQPCWTTGV